MITPECQTVKWLIINSPFSLNSRDINITINNEMYGVYIKTKQQKVYKCTMREREIAIMLPKVFPWLSIWTNSGDFFCFLAGVPVDCDTVTTSFLCQPIQLITMETGLLWAESAMMLDSASEESFWQLATMSTNQKISTSCNFPFHIEIDQLYIKYILHQLLYGDEN